MPQPHERLNSFIPRNQNAPKPKEEMSAPRLEMQMQMTPPANLEEEQRKIEKFYKGGHLTQKGFFEIDKGRRIIRSFSMHTNSLKKPTIAQNFFPEWVQDIPGLLDILTVLAQDQTIDGDFRNRLANSGFPTEGVSV